MKTRRSRPTRRSPRLALGLLGLAVLAAGSAADAAMLRLEWTGQVTSIDTDPNRPPGVLAENAAALVQVGSAARYSVIIDDAIPPETEFSDTFNLELEFRQAVKSYSFQAGGLKVSGAGGILRFDTLIDPRIDPNGEASDDFSGRASLSHRQTLPTDHALAGTAFDVFISDRFPPLADGARLTEDIQGALSLLQVQPGEIPADSANGVVDLFLESNDGQQENFLIGIDFDTSSIAAVPLPPAAALLAPALALLVCMRRQKLGVRS